MLVALLVVPHATQHHTATKSHQHQKSESLLSTTHSSHNIQTFSILLLHNPSFSSHLNSHPQYSFIMASSVMAGASSSCSVAFSTRTQSSSSSKPCLPHLPQKTNFHGLSLQDAKRVIFSSLVAERKSNLTSFRRGFKISAKAAGAAKTIEVEVDKPLGLTLGQKPGGGVVIAAVDGGGNAAKAGLKAGDQVLYTSSFFGEELWPAEKLGFTKTAIQAKADSVYFVVNRGPEVDVKKLMKRPAPPRFGRKLTDAQKARATHICIDCGFIYTLSKPFEEQPEDYACPQCRAPKKRFARYDVNTGKPVGGALPPIGVIIGLLAGVGAVGALLVYGLQ